MSSSPSIGSAPVHLQNTQNDRLKQANRQLKRALNRLENFNVSIQNPSEFKQKHDEIKDLIERIEKIKIKLAGIETTNDSKSLIKRVTAKLDRCDTLLRSAHIALVDAHDLCARTSSQLTIHEYLGEHEETRAQRAPSDQDEKELMFADLFVARESYCSNTVTA